MKKISEVLSVKSVNKIVNSITSVRFIVSLAILLALSTFVAWNYYNTSNADRVFWGMVEHNLRTSAYTRHTKQSSGSQSVDQVLKTVTSPENRVYTETVFTQTGVDSAEAVTENVGTPTHDYVQYTSIQTSQKDTAGKPLDFTKVLNLWGATTPEEAGKTTGQIYNQAVLGIIPTGNISVSDRREIIKIMKDMDAYSYKVVETKRSWPFGRTNYTFQVTISPEGYITALQKFASTVGLNHLEGIDPSDYKAAQKLSFVINVDGWTRQLTSTSQGEGSKQK